MGPGPEGIGSVMGMSPGPAGGSTTGGSGTQVGCGGVSLGGGVSAGGSCEGCGGDWMGGMGWGAGKGMGSFSNKSKTVVTQTSMAPAPCLPDKAAFLPPHLHRAGVKLRNLGLH